MTREEATKMIRDDMKKHHDYLSGTYRKALNMAIKALEQPEPCEDAANKIKNASFVGGDGLDYVETLVALEALKLATAQPESCEDAVNRKDLEKVAEDFKSYVEWLDMPRDDRNGIISYIDDMLKVPSVTPKTERTHGHWIHKGCGCFECNRCGKFVSTNAYVVEKVSDRFKFCPNCGAKMEGEQDGCEREN